MANTYLNVPKAAVIPKYTTLVNLPSTGVSGGDLAAVLDTDTLYIYDADTAAWVAVGGAGVPLAVTDTNTVDMTLASNNLQSDVLYQSTNSVVISDDVSGLKADLQIQDTNTVDLTIDGSGLKGDLTYEDSNSVNLTDSATGLKADVVTQNSNTVTLSEDVSGIKADVNYQDTATLDLSDDGSGFKGDVLPGGVDHDALLNFVTGEHTDAQVKVSSNDTTPGYLEDKIVSADNKLTITTLNDAGDEDVQLAVEEGNIDHNALTNYVANEHIDWTNATDNFVTTGTADVETVQLETGVSPSYSEGLVYYDNVNKCLAFFNDESDSSMQVGQEMWIRVKNTTVSTITNGQVVYLNGIDSGVPTVDLAQADAAATSLPTLGIATHDIEAGTIGYVTRMGTVRELNTLSCAAGDILYLSATVAGGFVNSEPTSPNYSVRLGNCGVSDGSVGTIESSISAGGNTRAVIKIFNGAILEDHTIDVTSAAGTVSLSLEKNGGGDLSLFFDGQFTFFDSDPAATVSLTAGSDTVPTLNYVYIPKSTTILTTSTVGFPTGEQFIPVATVLVQSAANVETDGAYKVHAWTDHLSDSVDQGHMSHINKWIRNQNATWKSGVASTFSGSGTGTVGLAITSGSILQLHEHAFPAFSDPADIYVVNDSGTPYNKITNIADIVTDSTGATVLNRTYSLVFWGSVNEDSDDCKIYCNLPSGSYTKNQPGLASSDLSKYTNYGIPEDFKGTGFLFFRLVIDANPGGTTFTIYSEDGDDIRGQFPNTVAGTSTSVGTEFADNVFRVQNVTDTTKELAFDVASVTASNTRTVTIQDADGIMAYSSTGDLNETSFAAANNQAAPANVTGFIFANGTVRSFEANVSVEIDATADLYEEFTLKGIQKGADWEMSASSLGDTSGIVFSITSAGQLQYVSDNESGFVSSAIKFRSITTSV